MFKKDLSIGGSVLAPTSHQCSLYYVLEVKGSRPIS
jgi:hypothetical protein